MCMFYNIYMGDTKFYPNLKHWFITVLQIQTVEISHHLWKVLEKMRRRRPFCYGE